MERIAAVAGVNKQLLFHYFGSKEGLFAGALPGLLARAEISSIGDTEPPANALRRMIAAVQEAASKMPGVLTMLGGSTADASVPSEAVTACRRWRARTLEQLHGAVAEGQRRGFFRDDIDPASVADVALAAALGAAALQHEAHAAPTIAAFLADYCAWR